MSDTRLLLVAGEVSGDIHGGNLLAQLVRLLPGIESFGIGGERLSGAGLECLERSEALAHMGLAEVARELPRIREIMRRLVLEAERRQPRAAVLIDSPDFNLRLARRLCRLSIPVVLYVSPQLWAWWRGRGPVHPSLRGRVLSAVRCTGTIRGASAD
jgi:lipid-A-disaccharide synthase